MEAVISSSIQANIKRFAEFSSYIENFQGPVTLKQCLELREQAKIRSFASRYSYRALKEILNEQ